MSTHRLRPLHSDAAPPGDDVGLEPFAVAIQMTRMPMVLANPNVADCPIVYCNQAFLDLTGYAAHEVVGRNCRFLQGPDTDRETVRRIASALAVREDVHEEILNYRKDGSHFWNALQVNAIVDANGKLTYFFASQQDVTRRREAAARQIQRMDSLGALASGIAHEVNNLMTVVVSSVEQAAARAVDGRHLEQLRRADWGARKAGDLASQLLAMARKQTDELTVAELSDVVREFESTIAQDNPAGVTVSFDLAAAPACLDPGQLEMVLLNLVRNSRVALTNGGHIVVRTRTLSTADAMNVLGIADAVEVSVADDGEGMTPEVAARATEPFFTTRNRQGGTGLGLFLALSFAEQAGGRLMIETAPGRGTTVRILVPHTRLG